MEKLSDPNVSTAWVLWIYPFFFDWSTFAVDGMSEWVPWISCFSADKIAELREEGRFFVPQLNRMLFGDLQGGSDNVVRHLRWLESDQELTFTLPWPAAGDAPIRARMSWMDAWVFPPPFRPLHRDRPPLAVGFLVTRVELPSPNWREVLRLASVGRNVLEAQPGQVMPTMTVDGSSVGTIEDLLEERLRHLVRPPPGAKSICRSEPAEVFARFHRQVWFTQLEAEGLQQSDDRFGTVRNRRLFELTVGSEAVGTWAPAREQITFLARTALLSYWDSWAVLCNHDDLAFVADASTGAGSAGEFVATYTTRSIEISYTPSLLLATYLYLSLQLLSDEVVRLDDSLDARISMANAASETLVEFHNRVWFEDITVHPVGRALSRMIHDSLRIDLLYRTLKEDLELLSDLYEQRARRDGEQKLRFLTYGLIPATIFSAVGSLAGLTAMVIIAAVLVGTGIMLLALQLPFLSSAWQNRAHRKILRR